MAAIFSVPKITAFTELARFLFYTDYLVHGVVYRLLKLEPLLASAWATHS